MMPFYECVGGKLKEKSLLGEAWEISLSNQYVEIRPNLTGTYGGMDIRINEVSGASLSNPRVVHLVSEPFLADDFNRLVISHGRYDHNGSGWFSLYLVDDSGNVLVTIGYRSWMMYSETDLSPFKGKVCRVRIVSESYGASQQTLYFLACKLIGVE